MKKTILFLLLGLMSLASTQTVQAAKEIYAVLSSDKKTMTLRYDAYRAANNGVTDWSEYKTTVTKVVFHDSFKNARPTSTYNWFASFEKLEQIQNTAFLNTSEVTTMNSMFQNCKALKTIDLSTWDISNVENTNLMFYRCSALTTIYCNNYWSQSAKLKSSDLMFTLCTSLQGDQGTTYKSGEDQEKKFARPDGGFPEPGYFTRVNEVYTEFDESTGTLTFYYDKNRTSRSGKTDIYDPIDNLYNGRFRDYHEKVITAVIDPSMKQAPLTSMMRMFSGVEYIDNSYSYYNLSNMTSISGLENLNTTNVTDMISMFDYCSSLQTLDLHTFNTANVAHMGLMFGDCKSLTEIKGLENFNTENLFNMTQMFIDCKSLTSIDLSSFNMDKVTNIQNMFLNCDKLTTIYCNVDLSVNENLSPGNDVFKNCNSLVGGKGTTYDATKTTKEYARPDDPENGKPGYFTAKKDVYTVFANGTLTYYYDDKRATRSGIIELYKPNSVRFADYQYQVKAIVIDPSLKDAELTSMQYFFHGTGSYSLENVKTITGLENLNTTNVTDMSFMFYSCMSLTSLDLQSFDFSNVKATTRMFSNCKALTTIWCEEDLSINTNLTQSGYMFMGCSALVGGKGTTYDKTHVNKAYARPDGGTDEPGYFTKKDPEVYTELKGNTLTYYFDKYRETRTGATELYAPNDTRFVGYAEKVTEVVIHPSMMQADITSTKNLFYGGGTQELINLKKIKGLEYLNTEKVSDMSFMFYGCSKLTKLDLNSLSIEAVQDLRNMFAWCSSLTTIICDADWSEADNWTLSDNMFVECTSLVGGNNTAYDATHTDITYARADDPENGKPGYFTHTGPEVYTQFDEETGTLTYFYDMNRQDRPGITELYDPDEARFIGYNDKVLKAVIDPSMQNAQLKSMSSLFYGGIDQATFTILNLAKMTSIEGLSNLNTTHVTDMNAMFLMCEALTTVDVSAFNTANVTDMSAMFMACNKLEQLNLYSFDISKVEKLQMMFNGCQALTTIYCENDWTATTANTQYLFSACKALVGGQGSAYADLKVDDATYARPDEGPEKPGYFSIKKSDPDPEKPEQALDQVQSDKVQCTKVMENGVLYLNHNGRMYNVQGIKIR